MLPMPIPSETLAALAADLVRDLQTQRSAGGLSAYAQEKLGSLKSLEGVEPNLRKALAGETVEQVWANVEACYQRLFNASFLASPAYPSALENLRKTLEQGTQPLDLPPTLGELPETVAIILMDADHFSLDREQETYLQRHTRCKILYRVAFANWKNRSNDLDLHTRHYLLIHVPAGQDRTDGAMLAFGSAIQNHYPSVRLVFIASNDQIFTSLATNLVQQNYGVYRMTQHGDQVSVQNMETGDKWQIPKPGVSMATLMDRVRKLYQELHGGHFWVPITTLEESYRQEYGRDFAVDLEERVEGNSLLAFLQKCPKYFVVHQLPDQPGLSWVSLFSKPLATVKNSARSSGKGQAGRSNVAPTGTLNPTLEPQPVAIRTIAPSNNGLDERYLDFEDILLGLLTSLVQESPQKYPDGLVSLNDLSSHYKAEYGQAINNACKQTVGGTIGGFLSHPKVQRLETVKVETGKNSKLWFVKIKNSIPVFTPMGTPLVTNS